MTVLPMDTVAMTMYINNLCKYAQVYFYLGKLLSHVVNFTSFKGTFYILLTWNYASQVT